MAWIQVVIAVIKLINQAIPAPSNWQDKEAVVTWLTTLNDPTGNMIVEVAKLIGDKKVGDAGGLDRLIAKLEEECYGKNDACGDEFD